MKTDAIFYELIRELPQIFFELIGKPETNTDIYEFTAPEIKQQSLKKLLFIKASSKALS
ncbi:DUF2887 domain-containing protein [Calothrix sp. FACHB-156]|nr:DUF2887 domain-containing protein [Nostoc linckia FACHB-104]MBD2338698.1 DUF2887 domain-containing protein [Calothrix sp. FACHB-156]